MGTVDIRRSTLGSPDAARLIAALNAELKAKFPEPGVTRFRPQGPLLMRYTEAPRAGESTD